MPESNIEIVKSAYDAILKRDIAAALAFFDENVEAYQTDKLPWGGRYVGKAELLDFFTRMLGALEPRLDIDEMFDAGERVVVIARTHGKVRVTNAAYDVRIVHIWGLHHSKITRFESFMDTPGMLRAMGRS